mmetsp:Transcript_2977/g.4510  ORF Transcript_2977/g.4510 Transcript_2977/m.4510 type:complete len:299 (-) Transcript_2977:1004-1900(-)
MSSNHHNFATFLLLSLINLLINLSTSSGNVVFSYCGHVIVSHCLHSPQHHIPRKLQQLLRQSPSPHQLHHVHHVTISSPFHQHLVLHISSPFPPLDCARNRSPLNVSRQPLQYMTHVAPSYSHAPRLQPLSHSHPRARSRRHLQSVSPRSLARLVLLSTQLLAPGTRFAQLPASQRVLHLQFDPPHPEVADCLPSIQPSSDRLSTYAPSLHNQNIPLAWASGTVSPYVHALRIGSIFRPGYKCSPCVQLPHNDNTSTIPSTLTCTSPTYSPTHSHHASPRVRPTWCLVLLHFPHLGPW